MEKHSSMAGTFLNSFGMAGLAFNMFFIKNSGIKRSKTEKVSFQGS
jgi:hypothetical protein